MDDSTFASLSPTLLARKGGAKPAMRPQLAPLDNSNVAQNLEDLGWNDMGEDDDTKPTSDNIVALTPAPSHPDAVGGVSETDKAANDELRSVLNEKPQVVAQREQLAERYSAEDEHAEDEDGVFEPSYGDAAYDAPAQSADDDVADAHSVLSKKPEAPANSVAAPAAKKKLARRAASARGKRAAFTLRLDQDRHLKLRLACTVRNSSAQQIVTDALDAFLSDMPEIDNLAAQVARN